MTLKTLALLACSLTAAHGAITLDFEGIATYPNGTGVAINGFYNGGTASNGASGTNYGVEFTSNAGLLCLNDLTNNCSNTSKGGQGVAGSEFYGMYFESGSPIMNVAAGFDTGFSFAYSNPSGASATVQVWSGLNGTGTLLGSLTLGTTSDGAVACPGYSAAYCTFENGSIAFSGTARSVAFTGTANQSAYDDFTFGSVTVGGDSNVPEPATVGLTAAALAGLAMAHRRRGNRA